MKRRSNAEIEETTRIYHAVSRVANDISERVNADVTWESVSSDATWVSVTVPSIWGRKVQFQRDAATDIEVSFTTKDPVLAERAAAALRQVLVEAAKEKA